MYSDSFSKECLSTALLTLMQSKKINEISITELCNKAGISRMTFYRFYIEKEDIIREYINKIGCFFSTNYNNLIDVDFYTYLILLFKELKKCVPLTKALLQSNISYIIQEFFIEIFSKNTIPDGVGCNKYLPYTNHYFSGALWNIYVYWIKNDLKETEEELSKIICSIINETKVA